jgi:hypothetical protein
MGRGGDVERRRWGEEEMGRGGDGVNVILNWYSFGSQKWYRFSCPFVLHFLAVSSKYYG